MDLDGVDVEAVKGTLRKFVDEAAPVNASSAGVMTTHSKPKCGRPDALAMSEEVRPILNRLYPEWRKENGESTSFEFRQERDASSRLLARLDSWAEVDGMLGPANDSPKLVADQLHPLVWSAAQAQWSTGHLQEAVLAAAKAVNSQLQNKLERRDLSDVKLVRDAFTDKPPAAGRARLGFPSINDVQTRSSMREGVMNFGAGCFMAIRNPVGHLPNAEIEFTEQEALERLSAFSLLARWIDEAEVISC